MARLVREAVEAGALGFSTSRTLGHRAMDGEPVPGTFAAEDELFGLGRAMAAGGHAVFELAPEGVAGEDILAPQRELAWMERLGGEIDRPVSFALIQIDADPYLWREQLAFRRPRTPREVGCIRRSPRGRSGCCSVFPATTVRPSPHLSQAAGRARPRRTRGAAGRSGCQINHPVRDGSADRPFGALRQHVRGGAALAGPPVCAGDPPDYDPTRDRTVKAIARERGEDPLSTLYDLMLERDATAMLMLPLFNYADGNHDAIREMMTHPAGVLGLSDGGAHCGMICDASYPTFLLTHWARDRHRGEKLSLEYVIRKQSRDTADLFGLTDRGTIERGQEGRHQRHRHGRR